MLRLLYVLRAALGRHIGLRPRVSQSGPRRDANSASALGRRFGVRSGTPNRLRRQIGLSSRRAPAQNLVASPKLASRCPPSRAHLASGSDHIAWRFHRCREPEHMHLRYGRLALGAESPNQEMSQSQGASATQRLSHNNEKVLWGPQVQQLLLCSVRQSRCCNWGEN